MLPTNCGNSPMPGSLNSDLEEILSLTEELWTQFRGARLLVTGGTGFMGCWLLESFLHANRRHDLGAKVVVLTRDPLAFAQKAPHLAQSPCLELVQGNVLNFPNLEGEFTHLIHGATDASAKLNEENPRLMFDTILTGTRGALEFAQAKSVQRALFLSSGAVYGRQPFDLEYVGEDWHGAPDCADPRSAYAEGKRAAETLCAIYARQHGVEVSIARCFAFVGPHLPLDTHFAIGNFIRNAMDGGPILVRGDGTPFRSYLYATDLTVWLWHLLLRGDPGVAFNVGSEDALSIAELASEVGKEMGGIPISVQGQADPGRKPERYVPSTARIRSHLGLTQTISLREGIRRTAAWHAR
ncbi:MAG: NAD-dependent epimerase/dehydratase family protein [Holophaga sp.]|nr:NAD-dependent epimerase/dehydratase family protein [Holophaga sp.]